MTASSIFEAIAHRFGKQIRAGGLLHLSTNGDPTLVLVFKELGWSDPHPIEAAPIVAEEETATIVAPERAVLKAGKAKG